MKPLALTRWLDLDTLCDFLDPANGIPAGIAVDWLQDREVPPEDVCLLYARDKGACAGLDEMACPTCGYQAKTVLSGCVSSCMECAMAGQPGGVRRVNLWLLLGVDFPQATFAEWAGRLFGASREKVVGYPQLIADAVEFVGRSDTRFYRAVQERAARGNDHEYSIAYNRVLKAATREVKRRTLRLFPEVTRQLPPERSTHPSGSKIVRTLQAADFVPPESSSYLGYSAGPVRWRYNRIALDPKRTAAPAIRFGP